jgi:hypothetical protein
MPRRRPHDLAAKLILETSFVTTSAPTPLPAQTTPAPRSETSPPETAAFAADAPARDDALGQDGAIRLISELVCHARAETPLTIAALGGPGAGKSTFLARLATRIEALTAAARVGGSYVARAAVVRLAIDAGAPEAALAEATAHELAQRWPAFAGEALGAARDPRQEARDAAEADDAARQRLEAERRTLDEVEGRQARLVETVLYDAGGTRVDAYARARRGELDARQRAFGFSGDPIDAYKDLVRDVAGAGGPLGRALASVRALWAFQGQTRLLVWAALAFALAWGLGHAVEGRASWLGWLRAAGEQMKPAVDAIEAHIGWLSSLRSLAILTGLAALALNLSRAFRFMRPILRGVAYLGEDVDLRKRELESLVAHHARRVETLTDEAEAAARRLAEAERRLAPAGAGQGGEWPFASAPDAAALARAWFAHVDRLIAAGKPDGPQRLVFALDGFDRLAPAARLDAALRLASLSRHAAVLLALDPAGLDPVGLDRLTQLPLQLGDVTGERASGFVSALLHPAPPRAAPAPDFAHSLFDDALHDDESALLAAIAPLAGASPRALKRFVNLYRVARHAAPQARPALALALAVETGGDAAERAAFDARVAGSEAPLTPRLAAAFAAAGVTPDTLAAGARIARAFSLRG